MRARGSQMSGKGYGSRDSVQAPLTLITAFGRLASSSTFGRSAQGCGGAGGTRGCRIPRWAMDEPRVGMPIDQRSTHVQIAPEQHVDRKIETSGCTQYPVEARVVRLAPRLF